MLKNAHQSINLVMPPPTSTTRVWWPRSPWKSGKSLSKKQRPPRRPALAPPRQRRPAATKAAAAVAAPSLLPVETVASADYWKRLCPRLHVGDVAFCAACGSTARIGASERAAMRARLIEDGYYTTPPDGGWLPSAVSLPDVRDGMRRIVEVGWPATMILMFDEAWAIAHHFASLIGAVSGNEMSFDMLAWLVAPAEGQAGFAPHRDRQPADVRGSFHADGMPKYCTAWVALGDATPDNSCMCVSPRRSPDDPTLGCLECMCVCVRARARQVPDPARR